MSSNGNGENTSRNSPVMQKEKFIEITKTYGVFLRAGAMTNYCIIKIFL